MSSVGRRAVSGEPWRCAVVPKAPASQHASDGRRRLRRIGTSGTKGPYAHQMTELTDVRADLRRLLDAVQAAAPVQAVDVLASELARMVAADDVSFLIADFSGDALIRLPGSARSGGTRIGAPGGTASVQLSGSPHERAIRCQEVVVERRSAGTQIFAPVTERGDALGVLELTVPQSPDEDMVTFLASAAHALAYVIIANRRHTDLFERSQREVPFSLAAEIQRRLLPAAFTCEASEATIAGWLEPASSVGGDTFDYSLEHDALHLSISDAMGHTVDAAQLATLAVGSAPYLVSARQVLGATGGQLRDDATVLVVDWYGRDRGGGGDRVARAGAAQSLASAAEDATGATRTRLQASR